MLKVGTLFSGGLAALEWAMKHEGLEYELVFACEMDIHARKQYRKFHGEPTGQFYISVDDNPLNLYKPFVWSLDCVLNSHRAKTISKKQEDKDAISKWKKKHEDVRKRLKYTSGKIKLIDFSNVMTNEHLKKMNFLLDGIIYGSPCQDLSLAGKRKGFDGVKSSLFRHGARIHQAIMPKVFIFENVKGLLSSNKGADYAEVIKTFQDMGYLIAMKVMNTKDYGVPQNRERVFIVGFLDDGAYHAFSFEKPILLTKTLRDYLDDEVEEKYYLSEKMVNGFIKKDNNFQGSFSVKDVDNSLANCLDTKEGNRRTNNFIPSKMKIQAFHNKDDSHCATLTARYHKCGITDPYIKEPMKILEDDILNPLKGKTEFGWHFEQKVYDIDSKCTRALTASEGSGSREKVLLHDYRIRKLTPKECFKLQGVKESCIDLVVSDSQAYKIAGNAISVNVMQSLLRSLYKPVSKKDTLF